MEAMWKQNVSCEVVAQRDLAGRRAHTPQQTHTHFLSFSARLSRTPAFGLIPTSRSEVGPTGVYGQAPRGAGPLSGAPQTSMPKKLELKNLDVTLVKPKERPVSDRSRPTINRLFAEKGHTRRQVRCARPRDVSLVN